MVGFAEFHQTIGGLEGSIARQGAEVRRFIGWLMVTFGVMAVLLGSAIMKRKRGLW